MIVVLFPDPFGPTTQVIPREKWILFSHQIIHHGRALCVARKPKCWNCIINDLCEYKDKTPAPAKVLPPAVTLSVD